MASQEEEPRVEALLQAECANSTSLALTQSTQMSATQRSMERQRIRDVVLSISKSAVLSHIKNAAASESTARQFALCLYSLSSVLPTDTAEVMTKSRQRLQTYGLAIFARLAGDSSFAACGAKLVCRIACSTLAHLDDDTACQLFGHIVSAVQNDAETAQELIMLLPLALAPLCNTADDPDAALLRQAKAQQCITQLCGLRWPSHLACPLLAALRGIAFSAQQQQQLSEAAMSACAHIAPGQLAGAAFETLQLSGAANQAKRLQAICSMMDTHVEEAADESDAKVQRVHAAQAEFLLRLQTHFARDKALSTAWLKDFKRAPLSSATAFAVSINAAGIARTQATALDAIKGSLLVALRRAETQGSSAWLRELCSNPAAELQDLAALLQRVVQASSREQAGSLVTTALHLMAAGQLKDTDTADLDALTRGSEGVRWWAVATGSMAQLSLAGVAMLEQVHERQLL